MCIGTFELFVSDYTSRPTAEEAKTKTNGPIPSQSPSQNWACMQRGMIWGWLWMACLGDIRRAKRLRKKYGHPAIRGRQTAPSQTFQNHPLNLELCIHTKPILNKLLHWGAVARSVCGNWDSRSKILSKQSGQPVKAWQNQLSADADLNNVGIILCLVFCSGLWSRQFHWRLRQCTSWVCSRWSRHRCYWQNGNQSHDSPCLAWECFAHCTGMQLWHRFHPESAQNLRR